MKLIFKRKKLPYKYRHIPEAGNFHASPRKNKIHKKVAVAVDKMQI